MTQEFTECLQEHYNSVLQSLQNNGSNYDFGYIYMNNNKLLVTFGNSNQPSNTLTIGKRIWNLQLVIDMNQNLTQQLA